MIGGCLVGLFNVLQPWCAGEGTPFIPLLLGATLTGSLSPGTMVGIGFVKLIATRVALSFGLVGGKFMPTIFLGGTVACAVYVWCNGGVPLVQSAAAPTIPLMFPLTCLMASPLVGLAPMFLSVPFMLSIVGLDGQQTACVFLSCATAYWALHGVGPGLVPTIFGVKLRKLIETRPVEAEAKAPAC